MTSSCRNTGNCNLYVYAHDRRIPYIQNMNLSIETEIAPNTNFSVTWLATNGVSLFGGRQLNEPNILAGAHGETILSAFNITREGGDSALFDDMFEGLTLGGRLVGPDGFSASTALRNWTQTDDFFADGEVAAFARFISETNRGGAGYGGMLRANGYPENFVKFNPQFHRLNYFDNGDSSTYHSLQTQITKRVSAGFSGQFTYTWSKAIGNGGSSSFRAREDWSFATRDPNNRNLQKSIVPIPPHAWVQRSRRVGTAVRSGPPAGLGRACRAGAGDRRLANLHDLQL